MHASGCVPEVLFFANSRLCVWDGWMWIGWLLAFEWLEVVSLTSL